VHRRPFRSPLAGLTLAAVLLGTAGCDAAATHRPGVVDVVAAENMWGDLARQIGGGHVAVTSIISDPNTDPHVYQSNPRAAADISGAQLVIDNGLGYDDFMTKILRAGSSGHRRVLTVADVLHVTGPDANPHLWYWTARLPAVAAAIAGQLAAIDPRDATTFRAGAARFDAALRPLLAVIATIKQRYAGTPIGYTERVPGYLVEAAGLRLATPSAFSQAVEDGNDPSPQSVAGFDSALTGHRVKVLLYNAQVVDAQTTAVRELAEQSGVPVVGVTETMPPAYRSFQAWQLAQDRALLAALGGGS